MSLGAAARAPPRPRHSLISSDSLPKRPPAATRRDADTIPQVAPPAESSARSAEGGSPTHGGAAETAGPAQVQQEKLPFKARDVEKEARRRMTIQIYQKEYKEKRGTGSLLTLVSEMDPKARLVCQSAEPPALHTARVDQLGRERGVRGVRRRSACAAAAQAIVCAIFMNTKEGESVIGRALRLSAGADAEGLAVRKRNAARFAQLKSLAELLERLVSRRRAPPACLPCAPSV